MNPTRAAATTSADGGAFVQNAHLITRPDGSSVIARAGAAAYEGYAGHRVTPVRGYDDADGRGFRITSRGDDQPGPARSHPGLPAGESR